MTYRKYLNLLPIPHVVLCVHILLELGHNLLLGVAQGDHDAAFEVGGDAFLEFVGEECACCLWSLVNMPPLLICVAIVVEREREGVGG